MHDRIAVGSVQLFLQQAFRRDVAPGGMHRFGQGVFGGGFENDAGGAAASPSSFYWDEDVRVIFRKIVLILRREFDHAASFVGIPESSENFPGNAEVRVAHVPVLFGFGKREGEFAELAGGHGSTRLRLKTLDH